MEIIKTVFNYPDGTILAVINPEYDAINQPEFKVLKDTSGYLDPKILIEAPDVPTTIFKEGEILEYLGSCKIDPQQIGPFRRKNVEGDDLPEGEDHPVFYAYLENLEHVEGSGAVSENAETFQEEEG